MPRLLNKHRATNADLAGAVYIGRGSKWGNPYVIGTHGTREEVIAKFIATVAPALVEAARKELRGKDLWCFCAPHACHGLFWLEVANEDR